METLDILLLTGGVGVGTGVAGLLTGTMGGYVVGRFAERWSKPLREWRSASKIGRIYVRGMIQQYSPSLSSAELRSSTNPHTIELLVDEALKDNVKGIIFDIDSPGGHPVPSMEIGDYITSISIPTVALVHDLGASGAYCIASACDEIVADPQSRIGSIGVKGRHIDFSQAAENFGIKVTNIGVGKFKNTFDQFHSLTDDERAMVEEEFKESYDAFVDVVAEWRHLKREHVVELANGWTYSGRKALDNGLIDYLGDFRKAQKVLEELGGFRNSKVADYTPKGGLGALFGGPKIKLPFGFR